jgi:hypothetical protein
MMAIFKVSLILSVLCCSNSSTRLSHEIRLSRKSKEDCHDFGFKMFLNIFAQRPPTAG